jgi:hypothetical protein
MMRMSPTITVFLYLKPAFAKMNECGRPCLEELGSLQRDLNCFAISLDNQTGAVAILSKFGIWQVFGLKERHSKPANN